MQAIKKMGPLSGVLGMMPGMPKELKNAKLDDDDLKPIEAIIRSMTAEERARPQLINGSRRTRIARGSGTETAEVSRLVKQFGDMQKMMKKMGMGGGGKKGKKRGGFPGLPGMGGMPDMSELEQMMGPQGQAGPGGFNPPR
jgi:signal recognition particle subunit SRP54